MFKFYVFKNDYTDDPDGLDPDNRLQLDSGSSVRFYKHHFFQSLRDFGEIIMVDESTPADQLIEWLKQPDAIVAHAHYAGEWAALLDQIQFRLIHLALGDPFLPEVYALKVLPSAQVELVSTEFIQHTVQAAFKDEFPRTAVFPPRVATEFFVPPTPDQKAAARAKYAIGPEQIHVIYVGRLVVNKGICQLIRLLDLWPIPNVTLTVVGNFDQADRLQHSVATHKTFPDYFRREILREKDRPWLRFQPSLKREELREVLWSADLYAYPSISPDENFGIASWEAAACGLPVVVTNFGGLHDLADGMPWKGVGTYPTLQGARFSLRAFQACLQRAIQARGTQPAETIPQFVQQTVSPEIARANLAAALDYLRQTAPEAIIPTDTAQPVMRRKLAQAIDRRAYRLFAWGRTVDTPPDPGMSVYGDVWNKPNWPLIYGLYSEANRPPHVTAHSVWRGFFRVALWPIEQALVEFGFPGPRLKRYSDQAWAALMACASDVSGNDYVFQPASPAQIRLVQELANYGYLVPD